MKRIIPAIAAILASSAPAFAHDAAMVHAHPHPDWSLTMLALVVGGLAIAGITVQAVRVRSRKDDER